MRRVSRERIVIVTFDPEVLAGLWIASDYFPEMLALKREALRRGGGQADVGLAEHLGGGEAEWSRAPADRPRERGLGAPLRAPAQPPIVGRGPAADLGSLPRSGLKRLRPGTVSAMKSERAKELLANERAQVEREIAATKGEGTEESDERREPGDQDSEGLYQDEFDAGRLEDLRGRLAAVERAEERLAAGTYGLSVRSGKPIPDERLEVVPTAELTVEESEPGGS